MEHVWRFTRMFTDLETDTDVECERGTIPFSLMEKLNNKEKITEDEKYWICTNSMDATCVKNQVCRNGWAYDFRPFMKRYLMNYHGQWVERYAFSKKQLQRAMGHYKCEIIEAPNKFKK